MQARSNGTKRPAMLDYEADCNKSVSVIMCGKHADVGLTKCYVMLKCFFPF